ncbi:MAG TPA: Na-translocating system protein MpsC family protein [Solirubrobacterales bacterium]|nr:Na-translocating system protein MpsC family protein [Solirubrobacterales bacterium]
MEGIQHGSTGGQTLAQISTGLVQLHSRFYGKGPTKAKTHIVDDTVISILRGGFTTVERTLIDQGDVDAVYAMRRSFQMAMEQQFTTVVEEATGRRVIAHMSQIHQDPDLAVEIFVLEPRGEPSPAPTEVRDLPEVG